MSETDKRKFKIELFCAIVVVFSIGVTYVANLVDVHNKTNEQAAIFDTKLTQIAVNSVDGSAINNAKETSVKGNILTFSATLPNSGDKISYLVTIKNNGNLDAYTNGITFNTKVNGELKANSYPLLAEYSGITNDQLIKAGSTKTFFVTLSYEKGAKITNPTLTYTLFVGFVQK